MDLDDWYQLDIESIETPEDWTGPVDDIERDDLGYTETDMEKDDWSTPLGETHETGARPGEPPEGEEDEWGEGYPEEEPWKGEE